MKILVTMDQAVKKEFTQTGKIKSSELSAYNKVVVHNTFSVLTLIPTIGVLDCTVGKIKDFDIKAQKKTNINSNFHPNSDVNPLYM